MDKILQGYYQTSRNNFCPWLYVRMCKCMSLNCIYLIEKTEKKRKQFSNMKRFYIIQMVLWRFRTTVSVLWLTIHSTILPLSVIVWVDFKGLEKRRGVAALQVGCRELQLPTSQWTKTVTGLPSVKKFRENTNTRTNKHWTTISNQSWWKSIIQKGKFVKSLK